METFTFQDTRLEVERRASLGLPDQVLPWSELTMTDSGALCLRGQTYALTGHATRQLSTKIGVRLAGKWFAQATPEERAAQVTARLARMPGEVKVRACRDETGRDAGRIRALLGPTMTPIDDVRIFRLLATMARGLVEDYRFARPVLTEATSLYVAVHKAPGPIAREGYVPGFCLRNSECGDSALTLHDWWCQRESGEGMAFDRALYRTHRPVQDDALAAALVIAIGRMPERWTATAALLERAQGVPVRHPDAAVAAILEDAAVVPSTCSEAAQREVSGSSATRLSVSLAVARVAHWTTEGDVAFEMARRAGAYLLATEAA